METFIFVTVLWIFSVCLHEWGHAIVAYKGGDETVKDKGYLEMNPLHYAHPIYSFVMPILFLMIGGLGLPGGAVYIEDRLIRSRGWLTAVSLAGPAMNIILVLVLCIPFWAGLVQPVDTSMAACALAFLIKLEISAVIFNLIPIPPLDGFQAMAAWFPGNAKDRLMEHSNTFFFIFIFLMWNVPVLNGIFWFAVHLVMMLLGINGNLAYAGYQEYRFWER